MSLIFGSSIKIEQQEAVPLHISNLFTSTGLDDRPTYTTLIDKKSLMLLRKHIDIFFKEYNKELYKIQQKKSKVIFSYSQCPQNISMFCIDIDNKIQSKELKELYTIDDVKDVINRTNMYLIEKYGDRIKNHLETVYLSKPPYLTADGFLKNGYHIQYVKLFLSKNDRQWIQKDTGIGDSIYNNNWLLYGSCKSKSTGTYKINKIYDKELNEINLLEFCNNYRIYNNHEKQITPSIYQISNILSIHIYGRGIYNIDEINKEPWHPPFVPREIVVNEDTEIVDKTLIEKIIKDKSSDDYKIWSVVGSCIFNLLGEDGIEIFKEWSENSSKYNEAECVKKYRKFKPTKKYNLKYLINCCSYKDEIEDHKRLLK
jgi:hypothetical protein